MVVVVVVFKGRIRRESACDSKRSSSLHFAFSLCEEECRSKTLSTLTFDAFQKREEEEEEEEEEEALIFKIFLFSRVLKSAP